MCRAAAHSDFDSMLKTCASLKHPKGKNEEGNWSYIHRVTGNCYLLRKEKSVFFDSVAMFQWRIIYLREFRAAKIGLEVLKNKRRKVEWIGKVGWIWEELAVNTIKTCCTKVEYLKEQTINKQKLKAELRQECVLWVSFDPFRCISSSWGFENFHLNTEDYLDLSVTS